MWNSGEGDQTCGPCGAVTGDMRRHILTDYVGQYRGMERATLWEGTTKQPGEIGWLKRGFERPEKLGQNKEAGNKMAWGRRGKRAYTNESRKQGARERLHFSYPLPGKGGKGEWSCITWTREQGVRERPHSSYPLLGKGGNGQEQREHGYRGVRVKAELQLHHARRIGERWKMVDQHSCIRMGVGCT